MEEIVFESFCFLQVWLFFSILKLDFREDHLIDILQEPIDIINAHYTQYFKIRFVNAKIVIDILDYQGFEKVDKNVIRMLDMIVQPMLSDDVFSYIDTYIDSPYKYRLKILFLLICGKIKNKYFFNRYVKSMKNNILKNLFLLKHCGIGSYTIERLKESIDHLNVLIEKYPRICCFYLLRARQNFDMLYRCMIGKVAFNRLVVHEKGRTFLYENPILKSIFNDFQKADEVYPEHSSFYFFKGKFLLHLLDSQGLDLLYKYLEKKGLYYDFNVYSWIGVYYLQMGDANKADFFIHISNYDYEDKYKEYAKQIFLHILYNDFQKFMDYLERHKMQILLFIKGKYYEYQGSGLVENDFKDDVYLSTKMGFKFANTDFLFKERVFQKNELLENVYENISKSFHDHWNSSLEDKVVFIYPDYKRLMGK